MKQNKKKRVLLAMSGGIDSSIAAFLLQEQGYEVVGAHLKFWFDDSDAARDAKMVENKCCSYEDYLLCLELGKRLNFEVKMIDYRDVFKEGVVDYFLDAHKRGVTPNPCTMCNQKVKFGVFFDLMKEMGCDYVASGHYVQVVSIDKEVQVGSSVAKAMDDRNTEPALALCLQEGVDKKKDQSYFLYHLNAWQLEHVLFPVGGMDKSKTKELAQQYEIFKIAAKKESQGVCFFPEASYIPFLERNHPELFEDGDVVYHDQIIGRHRGLPKYTIGQRRGIDIGGFPKPIYVIGFDYEKNVLVMGDDAELLTRGLVAESFILTGKSEELGKEELQAFFDGKEVWARIRHLGEKYSCKVEFLSELELRVDFDEDVRAITAGQNVVFYGRDGVVLGGAVIKV